MLRFFSSKIQIAISQSVLHVILGHTLVFVHKYLSILKSQFSVTVMLITLKYWMITRLLCANRMTYNTGYGKTCIPLRFLQFCCYYDSRIKVSRLIYNTGIRSFRKLFLLLCLSYPSKILCHFLEFGDIFGLHSASDRPLIFPPDVII